MKNTVKIRGVLAPGTVKIMVAVLQHPDGRISGYVRRVDPLSPGHKPFNALAFRQSARRMWTTEWQAQQTASQQCEQNRTKGFVPLLMGEYVVARQTDLERNLAFQIASVINDNDDFGSSNLQKGRAIHALLQPSPDLVASAAMSASRTIQPVASWFF